jgi:hypothetical protein
MLVYSIRPIEYLFFFISNKFHIKKDLSSENLKQGGALSLLLPKLSLEYNIRKEQVNTGEHNLNGTLKLLVYVDEVNLLGDDIDPVRKNFNGRQ